MQEQLYQFLLEYRAFAIPVSLLLNILIAIAGVLPTYFLTAVNVLLFGPVWGGLLSAAGESLGAATAFAIYRKGLKPISDKKLMQYKLLKKVLKTNRKTAGFWVIVLRLIPYIPSGLVTLAASLGNLTFWQFVITSTLGKIPALAIEVITVSYVIQLPVKWILVALAAALIIPWGVSKIIAISKKKKARNETNACEQDKQQSR